MQCLDYALDQLRTQGGYLLAGRSVHWPVAHVMHSSVPPGALTHYLPPSELPQPWHSLFGFEGAIETGDKDLRLPMSRRAIVGSLALALALSVWWAGRSWLKEVRNDAR